MDMFDEASMMEKIIAMNWAKKPTLQESKRQRDKVVNAIWTYLEGRADTILKDYKAFPELPLSNFMKETAIVNAKCDEFKKLVEFLNTLK